MTMSELLPPPCQQILETQGYLVLGCTAESEIGDVIPHASGGAGYSDIPGPMLVIGKSTKEEWLEQYRRFGRKGAPSIAHPFKHFIKVIAE